MFRTWVTHLESSEHLDRATLENKGVGGRRKSDEKVPIAPNYKIRRNAVYTYFDVYAVLNV